MEHHTFTGTPHGEPMTAGRAGARVRIALDAPPSPRWSRAFASTLTSGLVGCPGVSHLRLDQVVQGAEVVLEGIEVEDSGRLSRALRAAVDGANEACDRPAPGDDPSTNMDQATADRVAGAVATDLAG